jgi:hypothetical protein
MAAEATLRGDHCQLVLRVERYERPQETTGIGGNWLVGEVQLDVGMVGSFKARRRISVLTTELKDFRDQLQTLDRDLAGEATLHNLESQLGATVTLKAGKGTIAGYVREDVGAALRFEQITIDQTFVREALQQFDAMVTAFPIRGDPSRLIPH